MDTFLGSKTELLHVNHDWGLLSVGLIQNFANNCILHHDFIQTLHWLNILKDHNLSGMKFSMVVLLMAFVTF
jgi:hypothetical protein